MVRHFPSFVHRRSGYLLFVRCLQSFLWGIKFRRQYLCTKYDYWSVISLLSRRQRVDVCVCVFPCMHVSVCVCTVNLTPSFFLAFYSACESSISLVAVINQTASIVSEQLNPCHHKQGTCTCSLESRNSHSSFSQPGFLHFSTFLGIQLKHFK